MVSQKGALKATAEVSLIFQFLIVRLKSERYNIYIGYFMGSEQLKISNPLKPS